MIKKITAFLFAIMIFFSANANIANGISCSAEAAAVIDASSGRILYEKNGKKKLAPASTTKIMTALCAIKYGDLSSVAKVSKNAAGAEGSSMYLKPGEKLSLSALLTGLMLVSGNDAAVAVAEHISKTEGGFVSLMNQTANEIGAKNTCFQNPNGLPCENHYTTALDLAKISAYAMRYPFFEKTVSTKSAKVTTEKGEIKYLSNHNRLLKLYEGCIGIKTGFTKAAGRCLVSCAERDGLRLICVTLNDGDDWSDHAKLFDSCFEEYEAREYIKKGEKLTKAKVLGGEEKTISLVSKYAVSVAEKKGEKSKLSLSIKENLSLEAPVDSEKNEIIFDIIANGEKIGELVAAPEKSVKKAALKPKGSKTAKKFRFKIFFKK